MFKDVNKFLLYGIMFIMSAFVLLLFNELHHIFNIAFALFVIIGLILLTINKIIQFKNFKSEITSVTENSAIEMVLGDDGAYQTNNSPFSKKQLSTIKRLTKDKFMPIIIYIGITVIMVYLLIKLILN